MAIARTLGIAAAVVLASTAFAGQRATSKKRGPEGGVAGFACPCPGDIDGNGLVDDADLALVLGAWNTSNLAADLDGNGVVNAADLAILLGAWGPCALTPPNDNCADAAPISDGIWDFCTLNANTDGPELAPLTCGTDPYSQVAHDIWYSYTPIGDGTLTVSTCGLATFDTRIAIYHSILAGIVGCPMGQLVGCNDDSNAFGCQIGGLNRKSRVSIELGIGNTYFIHVTGYQGAVGGYELSVDVNGCGG